MTKKVKVGKAALENQSKLRLSITLIHIALISGFTIMTILQFFINGYAETNGSNRIYSFWVLFCGLSDAFITGTLLFVTAESDRPSVYIDRNTNQAYAVLNLIKQSESALAINDDQ